MRDDTFEVSVTFDEQRGYVGFHPELRSPVVALSLSGIRRQIEAARMECGFLACPRRGRSLVSNGWPVDPRHPVYRFKQR
jgi:hypothetical protein